AHRAACHCPTRRTHACTSEISHTEATKTRKRPRERRRPPHTWDGLPRKFCAIERWSLSAQSKTLDQRAVTLDVHALEVAEQTTTLTDEQEQPTTRVVVVLVLLEVLGEVLDALRQHCGLHLGGSGVTGVRRVLFDDRLLDVCFQCHRFDPLSLVARRATPDA